MVDSRFQPSPFLRQLADSIIKIINKRFPHYYIKQGTRVDGTIIEIGLSKTESHDFYHLLYITDNRLSYRPFPFQPAALHINLSEPDCIQKLLTTIETEAQKEDGDRFTPYCLNTYPLACPTI